MPVDDYYRRKRQDSLIDLDPDAERAAGTVDSIQQPPDITQTPSYTSSPQPQPEIQGNIERTITPTAPSGRDLAVAPMTDRQATFQKALDAQQEGYRAFPKSADTDVSKWRNFLSILGGVGMGAVTMNPSMGIEMGQSIHNAPYMGKVQAWREEQNVRDAMVKAAMAGGKFQGEQEKTEAETEEARQRGVEQRSLGKLYDIRAQKELNKAEPYEAHTEDEYRRKQMIDAEARRAGEKPTPDEGPYVAITNDGKELYGIVREIDDKGKSRFIKSDTRAPVDLSNLVDLYKPAPGRAMGSSPWSDILTQANRERRAAGQPPLSKDEMVALANSMHQREGSASADEIRQLRIEQMRQAAADKAEKKGYVTSDARMIAEGMSTSPEMFHDKNYSPEARAKAARLWYAGTGGVPPPVHLGAEADRYDTRAMVTLGHVKAIRQFMEVNPELKDYIGPIVGRVGQLGQHWGSGDIAGVPKELQAKAQQLRSQMEYFKIQEAATASGGRTGKYLLDALGNITPDTRMDWNMLSGALNGAEASAKQNTYMVLKKLYGTKGTAFFNGQEIPRFEHRIGKDGEYMTGVFSEKDGRYHPLRFPEEAE